VRGKGHDGSAKFLRIEGTKLTGEEDDLDALYVDVFVAIVAVVKFPMSP
jgi:hypothetical protein